MTPEQVALVEASMSSLDVDALAAALYERVFREAPSLLAMFAADPAVQQARFAAELREIVRSIRAMEDFTGSVEALGRRHLGYGVHAAHYQLMGVALLATLADTLGDAWTEELAEAWSRAYDLTAETMLLGAMSGPDVG